VIVYAFLIVALIPLVLLLAVTGAERRAGSMTSRFRAEAEALVTKSPAVGQPEVTTEDLAGLPPAIRRYLQRAGVVGRPRVVNLRAVFSAQMRNGRDQPWMNATVEQWDFFTPKARLFLMSARRAGIPFVAFHRYVGADAMFEVRLAGLVRMFRVSGPTMTKSETVTLFNDMCLLAPATLIDRDISWTTMDATHVRAEFMNAGHRIAAVLTFNEEGDLVNFRSDDRHQNDGKRDRQLPWLTPVSGYRDFGEMRLAAYGEARWLEPDAEWTYGRFTLQRIDVNCTSAA
jgi:hypothetical protein